METSAFTWATKALEKLQEEKKQMGLDFYVGLEYFEELWLLGGTSGRCCFFWAVCFAAICVSVCCRIEANWRDTSHVPWCRLRVKISVIAFQFRFFLRIVRKM